MKPLGKRVLIEPIAEPHEEAVSGIVRPQDSKKKEVAKGKVIAVGKVDNVKVGDTVLFSPYHYDEINKNLFVIEETDIWVLVDETTTIE